jgi:hypothetical protein
VMRYNKHGTLYAAFGLMGLGLGLVLAGGITSLLTEPPYHYPAWAPRRVLRDLVTLLIGLDLFATITLVSYLVLQALARIETEALETKRDVHANTAEIRRILDRERHRYGIPARTPDPDGGP